MNIKLPEINKLIFLLSSAALIVAYISEYFFGLKPCNLCLYQRVPFFIISFLAILSISLVKNLKYKNYIIYLIILLFFINMILAIYHSGVEHKIFTLPASCTGGNILDIKDLDQLATAIMNQEAVKCDQATFIIFGITMANLNAIYCLFAIILIYLIRNDIFKSK